jgi:hypothetical protein
MVVATTVEAKAVITTALLLDWGQFLESHCVEVHSRGAGLRSDCRGDDGAA